MFGIVKESTLKVFFIIILAFPITTKAESLLNCNPQKYSEDILSILIPDYTWAKKLFPQVLCIEGNNYQIAFFMEKPGDYQRKVRKALMGTSTLYDMILLDSYALHEISSKHLRLQKFTNLNIKNILPKTLKQVKIKEDILALPIAVNMPLQVSKIGTKKTESWEDLIIQLEKELLLKDNIHSLAFPLIKGHASIRTLRGLTSGFTGRLSDINGKPDYLSLIPAFKALHKLYKLSWPVTKSSTGKDALEALINNNVRRAWALQSDVYSSIYYKKENNIWEYTSLPYIISKNNIVHSLSAYDVWMIALPISSRLKAKHSNDIVNNFIKHSSNLSNIMLPAIYNDINNLSNLAKIALTSLENNSKAPSLALNYRKLLRIVLGINMEKLIDEEENLVKLLTTSQNIALSYFNP